MVSPLKISIQNEPLSDRFKISSVAYSIQSGLADTSSYTLSIPEEYIETTLEQSTILSLYQSNINNSLFVTILL